MLIANDENVKVVQELMRHSSSRTTLEVYSQARIRAKREAQQRVVEMIMPEDTKIMMQHMGPESVWVTPRNYNRERADGMDQLDRFGSTANPKSLRI